MDLLDAYLDRLQLDAEPPSIGALSRLHRAHVERVPYETTWIHLGERWGIDQEASVERIVRRGRGGYCFHLNGSFAWLLRRLGYAVTLHVGGVHGDEQTPQSLTNHLVLLVSGLPSADNPGGTWYVDAGLGDALYEPLPLVDGSYQQGPMTFQLEHTPGGVGDWHLVHDPAGSFPGMNFRAEPAGLDAFEERHTVLSTSPESGFVRVPTVQRRHAAGVAIVRALTYTERRVGGVDSRVVDSRAEWFDLLADTLLLRLDGTNAAARDRLWSRAVAAHQQHAAAD